MKTEMLVLIPALLSWWTASSQSLGAAFLSVYLPVLLLIPDYFRLPIEGLPDPTFNQCAILPIGIAVFWRAAFHREWKLSGVDFLVFGYLAWQVMSNFRNVGFKDTQNLVFDVVTLAAFPYMAGKALIESGGIRLLFARRFVWLLFVVSLISTYEFKMGISLFRPLLTRFFPYQEPQWFTQFRWGFGRVAGPYGHAILMGSILAMGFLLCRWLAHSQQWEEHFKGLGEVPITKAQILTGGLLAGMFMTLSRGPWLGTVCGVVLASIGMSSNRRMALLRASAVLALGGVAVYAGGRAYIDNRPAPTTNLAEKLSSETNEQEQTAAYRADLLDKYYDIALEQPVWGWGRNHWPQVPGMASIDNNYLLIALNSGLVGVALFAAMLLTACVRLFRSGYFLGRLDRMERAFDFTLLGVLAAVAVSTATVFLGSQLYPLLFLFIGWGDSCVIRQAARVKVRKADLAASEFSFMRVVA